VLPAPDVLERSAVELPAPDVLLRFVLELLPAAFAPDVLERSAVLLPAPEVLDELPERPLPEVELASLRGEELLELPVLEPLPVLLPEPLAPDAPDSRTSETVTSGAPWLAGKVTIATPYPFCTPLEDEPLRPEELEELPLRPDDVEELPLKPLPLDELLVLRSVLDAPMPPEVEELLRSVDDDDEPIPPLVDDEPESPPLDVPLVSERRLLLPLLPLELPLLDEFTGQLLSRAGF
jgi:hypothetical protein